MSILGKDFNHVKAYGKYHSINVNDSYDIRSYASNRFDTYNDYREDSEEEYECWNEGVMKYINGDWCQYGYYNKCSPNTFPEIKIHHDKIIKYMNETKDMRSKLSMPNTISVGLISNPGMGKSTLIRMIASTLNKSICVIENESYDEIQRFDAVYVVEDYDRFTYDNKKALESFFNTVNGYEDTLIPIIFYTSNTTLDISTDITFKFTSHDIDTYMRSIDVLYPNLDNKEGLLALLMERNISMREVNQLLCAAYCSNISPITYVKDNIDREYNMSKDKYSNGSSVDYWY